MGPLAGVRVVELAGVGPGPFAGMMLADLGADVVRIERPTRAHETELGNELSVVLGRGRRSVALDLKHADGLEAALRLIDRAEIVYEGYRPGVAERLGVGPDVCLERNPALVYGRITGWGRTGPLAERAGHDLTYLAISGALGAIGPRDGPPVVPLNLIGDFGGGGMLLAFGLVSALLNARATGQGQVVDAAIVDGVASQLAPFVSQPHWGPRGTNSVDGGSPFYRVYETADGGHVAVAALEVPFYAGLLDLLGLDPALAAEQFDEATWPRTEALFAEAFASRTRDEWAAMTADRDVCVAPVLDLAEAVEHPHLVEREVFTTIDGRRQPSPAPRFSATPADPPAPTPPVGADGDDVLAEIGYDAAARALLRRDGVLG